MMFLLPLGSLPYLTRPGIWSCVMGHERVCVCYARATLEVETGCVEESFAPRSSLLLLLLYPHPLTRAKAANFSLTHVPYIYVYTHTHIYLYLFNWGSTLRASAYLTLDVYTKGAREKLSCSSYFPYTFYSHRPPHALSSNTLTLCYVCVTTVREYISLPNGRVEFPVVFKRLSCLFPPERVKACVLF